MAATPRPQHQPTQPATTVTRHTPHRPKRFHTRAESQGEPSHAQVRRLRRRTFRRLLAGAAALALAATGAITTAPGTAYADAHRDGQWYLDDFNIDKIHELSQGEGVTIGVIDSGIDPDHPDLKGNITKGAEFDNDGKTDGDGLTDTIGHGTAVTSVLAGHGHGTNNQDGILGIAPKAKIIPARVDWDNNKNVDTAVVHAFDYLIEQDVNIISVSLGPHPGTTDVVTRATEAGIAVIGSAGNRYTDTEWGTFDDPTTHWPARAKGAIPVSGTNQDKEFWDSSTDLSSAAPQPQLGLSAPATNIPIAMPNSKYDTVDGTSFSAPIVAGTLALIRSAYPKLGAWDVENRLLDTVDDKGKKGFDDKYGWGIVNPYKALTEETTFTDADGNDSVSSPDDRLPLEKQGDPVDNHPPDTTQDPIVTPDTDDEAAAEAPGPPAWLTITIVAAGALLTAALITLVTVKTRRGKKNHTPQTTGPPPPGHPGGPTPPTGPTPNFHTNPATQQPPGSTPPPQNPGPTPPHQPGQPDSAPPPTTGDAPWQPPQGPNTNPPPNQPPQ